MKKFTKEDPEFYSKLSKMRKNRVGGQTFKDREKAREYGRKGGLKTKKPVKDIMKEYLEEDGIPNIL